MKVYILGNFNDAQTGVYILEAFNKFSSDVVGLDTRAIVKEYGPVKAQVVILEDIDRQKKEFDLILVLKGLEMTLDTLETIRKKQPKAKIVNWFFDKYLGDTPIWENESYFETLDFYDYFFCSLKGVADKLNALGFINVHYLEEACHPPAHGEVLLNTFQRAKYGEDVTFVGTLGFLTQHKNRIPILEAVAKEGFNMKIWGDVICKWKHIPDVVKQYHMQKPVINRVHGMVARASLINLGIDQDFGIDKGFSARLYRVMCAGGFYLSCPSWGMGTMFKINKDKDAPITEDLDLVMFYTDDDMIEKIDYMLEHKELREKIAKNGQKTVYENHTFVHRLDEMLKIIEVK